MVTDGGEPPSTGPLAGVTVVELGGIGPLPLLAMLFADLGARIIRVDPVGPSYGTIGPHLWIFRGQESLTLDLRRQEGRERSSVSSSAPTSWSRATAPASPSGSASVPTCASPATRG